MYPRGLSQALAYAFVETPHGMYPFSFNTSMDPKSSSQVSGTGRLH